MKNFTNHIIHYKASIKQALKLLNETIDHQTLFVVDDNEKLIGTLTDGDIRRGFLNELGIEYPVNAFMNRRFHFLSEEICPKKIKEYRNSFVKLLPLLDQNNRIIKIFDLTRLKAILPIDAVIMAGGKGERLRPLTNKTPKPMLPLGNKPIIEHNIDRIISHGIKNIYISVNYLAEQIIEYFGDGSSWGVNIKYLKENQFLGTIGSLSLVSKFKSPHILIMNSDLFTDVDIEDLWLNLTEQGGDMAIASIPYTVNIPYAILDRKRGQIRGLKEKPSNTYYANAGIYLLKQEVAEMIPKKKYFNATDLIEKLISTGGKVIDNPITGYWIDIGRHEEYTKAKEIIKHLNKTN